jgi:diadenylate cyclase
VGIIDILDILAVTIVFYQIYRIMRGTRATQMFAGLLLLMVAGSAAQLLGMTGMSWLIQSVGAVWVIAFVILFQPELRRMLIQIGEMGFMKTLFRAGGQRAVSEVVHACMELSRRRIGGLIVFQRKTGIRGVVETGVTLHAEISWELLLSIFNPRTPLHDGAVIVIGDTIVAARCILPLAISPPSDGVFGTRHRAALGVTEEFDAVAVVVSEETGSISITKSGQFLARDLNDKDLTQELIRLLYPRSASLTEGAPAVPVPAEQ